MPTLANPEFGLWPPARMASLMCRNLKIFKANATPAVELGVTKHFGRSQQISDLDRSLTLSEDYRIELKSALELYLPIHFSLVDINCVE